jgi:hypothetical protein
MLLGEADELDPQAYAFEKLPTQEPFSNMAVQITVKGHPPVITVPIKWKPNMVMRGSGEMLWGVDYEDYDIPGPPTVAPMDWGIILESVFTGINEANEVVGSSPGRDPEDPEDNFPEYTWQIIGPPYADAFQHFNGYAPE